MGTYQIVMLVVVLGAMWFLLIRPQQQRQKQHQATVSSLKPGATIVTIGGLVAEVIEVRGDKILLKVADGGTMEYMKDAVGRVLPDEGLDASSTDDGALDQDVDDGSDDIDADADDTSDEDGDER